MPESTDIAADLLKLMASPNLAAAAGSGSNTTARSAPTPSSAPAATPRSCASTARRRRWRSPPTARRATATPTLIEGGKQAIAEAYRNLCAVGARPLAVTNCLNFGNPQRPEIMAQFVGCLEGMGEACRALDFPIVSGNVWLYNESKATGGGIAILPTPAIGGVGLLDDWEKSATIAFKAEGETLVSSSAQFEPAMLANRSGLKVCTADATARRRRVDLDHEKRIGGLPSPADRRWLVNAVHDVSDGGMLVAIAEMALAGISVPKSQK